MHRLRQRVNVLSAVVALAVIAVTAPAYAAFHLEYVDEEPRTLSVRPLVAARPTIRALERGERIAAQRAAARAAAVSRASVWDRLAQCESGGNWNINTGNGYSGGLQFLPSTWRAAGGTRYAPLPHQATREQQIAVAESWLAKTSWSQWPACSRKLGLR